MGHLDSPPLPHKALGITYMGIAVRSHQWSWEHTEIVVWELCEGKSSSYSFYESICNFLLEGASWEVLPGSTLTGSLPPLEAVKGQSCLKMAHNCTAIIIQDFYNLITKVSQRSEEGKKQSCALP